MMQKGGIFACTINTEKEIFDRMLFGTNNLYSEKALEIRKGDVLFLLNLDKDTISGPFMANSNGQKDIVQEAWSGKYPYQIEVAQFNGQIKTIENAKKLLLKLEIDWKININENRLELLLDYFKSPETFDWERTERIIKKITKEEKLTREEKPNLEATTLWDYPKQSYGSKPKGNNKYAGVTPAFLIYNLVKRYTEPGDVVLDPMAGSGTTIDVCVEEGRKCIAYDIVPTRSDIKQNDARKLPLQDSTVDMIFIDSPYGDNIKYNDSSDNFGVLSAEDEKFYDELEKTMKESNRVLKPGKTIAWLIGDQWVKKRFTPVGFKIYERLSRYFDTVDVVCVTRRNQSSNTGIWYNRALRFNFYLRGFKYLFIMRKPLNSSNSEESPKRKIEWKRYER